MSSSTRSIDVVLLLTIVALTLFGFMMIASSSVVVAQKFSHDPYYFFKHQLFYGGTTGLAAFLLGIFVPYRQWRHIALPGMVLSLILLLLVFIPGLRVQAGEATRWIGIGPVTIQPTEILKLAFIIYLAALLERKGEDVHSFRHSVVPFMILTGVIILLVALQPDIGTLVIITAIAAVMVFAGGFRLRHLALMALGGSAIFGLLFNMARYRLARIIVYLHPELDPQGIGYQINQALLAVGTGGIWGLGLGRSRQKYLYLPQPATDSIFAVMAEELGLARSLLVLGAFVLLGYKGFMIARAAPDTFARLLAVGITAWLTLQAFINVASILAITPLTGIPLPYISYGGSALVSVLFASGILLNISKYRCE